MSFTHLDYCQYLLTSPKNYTLTNLADHKITISHDTINKFLRKEEINPNIIWHNVKQTIKEEPDASIVLQDDLGLVMSPLKRVGLGHGNESLLVAVSHFTTHRLGFCTQPIQEHYTDTNGYTEHVFAMCHLLGFRFAPRMRDLPEKKLYTFGPTYPDSTYNCYSWMCSVH